MCTVKAMKGDNTLYVVYAWNAYRVCTQV